MSKFPYEPTPIQQLDDPAIDAATKSAVGDILQPWLDIGNDMEVSAFAAKAYFVMGMIRYYVLSANSVLEVMGHLGFPASYEILATAVELLGRCIHPDKIVRQAPVTKSKQRLEAGFNFIRRPHLPRGVIVETNYYKATRGGYCAQDLINLRNLVTHGGCITKVSDTKGDIELLHELRKALYGIPKGEEDPHQGEGPIEGAIDRYYNLLAYGDIDICDQLATAGVSPVNLRLQKTWPYDVAVVAETKRIIEANLTNAHCPVSGLHHKKYDAFQLYE